MQAVCDQAYFIRLSTHHVSFSPSSSLFLCLPPPPPSLSLSLCLLLLSFFPLPEYFSLYLNQEHCPPRLSTPPLPLIFLAHLYCLNFHAIYRQSITASAVSKYPCISPNIFKNRARAYKPKSNQLQNVYRAVILNYALFAGGRYDRCIQNRFVINP